MKSPHDFFHSFINGHLSVNNHANQSDYSLEEQVATYIPFPKTCWKEKRFVCPTGLIAHSFGLPGLHVAWISAENQQG